jgi:cyclophilin family peptidyl-prolyl cis-trans isomerase
MMRFVWPLLLQIVQPAAAQPVAGLERLLAQEEASRSLHGGAIASALASNDPTTQRLALRAIGRRQLPDARNAVLPFLASPNADVRAEAAFALGQMNVDAGLRRIGEEKDGRVRAVLYESAGRIASPAAGTVGVLVQGLTEADKVARTGAARGLESFVRQTVRIAHPTPATLDAIHGALLANHDVVTREYLLLAMNAARDTSSAIYEIALRDTSALVRRLAVIGAKQWVTDPSPLVRYEALKVAGTCERAGALSADASEMVALEAIDMLGARKCSSTPLEHLTRNGKTWRIRAHALVAEATMAPDAARRHLATFAASANWHERVYAATAARLLADSATLALLARDTQPNVAAEALSTNLDAIYALGSNHAGLLLAAANHLKGQPELVNLAPQIISAIEQPGMMARSSSADARTALLARLSEILQQEMAVVVRQYGAERATDTTLMSNNALRIAEELRKWSSTSENPPPALFNAPLQSAGAIARNRDATARITMKGLGVITLALLFDEAPRTVTTFATLADRGQYDGLTFHRVVPNFVLQGGSPGADEYDGQTEQFMRDEVGRTSHARGTLGISTRGYDKGDGQIFINLVDNFRLDYQYTVFARVTSGMNIVDRIQEGDVIESVKIIRKQ